MVLLVLLIVIVIAAESSILPCDAKRELGPKGRQILCRAEGPGDRVAQGIRPEGPTHVRSLRWGRVLGVSSQADRKCIGLSGLAMDGLEHRGLPASA